MDRYTLEPQNPLTSTPISKTINQFNNNSGLALMSQKSRIIEIGLDTFRAMRVLLHKPHKFAAGTSLKKSIVPKYELRN